MCAFGKREMQRDWRGRFRHGDRHLVIAHQKRQLFLEVVTEKLGPGDCRGVDAGRGDMAV